MKWCILVISLCFCQKIAQSYNILAIFPLQAKSHYVMYEKVIKGLVARGHEVDVVSHFPQKTQLQGVNDLSIAGTVPSFHNNISFAEVQQMSFVTALDEFMAVCGYQLCEKLFNTSVLQNLKNSTKKYDLLISEVFATDCMLGFAHIFNIPIVELTSSVNLPWGSDRIGNPDNPSYIPNYFVPFLSKMDLWERLINTLSLLFFKIGYDAISMRNSNTVAKQFFGEDLPDLRELAQGTSLFLVNSHFSTNQARPTVPNFIEVAGLHANQPKPLPKELEEVVQASKKGVIYFSTGSMLLSETIDPDKLQAIFDVFNQLPYTVLWKAKRERFPDGLTIPNNIHFQEWMPQLDILCHPNVKLFISHGGLMGTQEAIYCGVPILGIPVFADQFLNVKQSVAMGISKLVNYEDITKETFLSATKSLLDDPKYRQTVKDISNKFKDRPNTPLDTAIFWIEYVIRHNGAPQLRSVGADLPWYQYFLVDVIAIISSSIIVIVVLAYYSISKLLQLLSGLKNKTKEKRS